MWPADEVLTDARRRLVADPTAAGEFAALVLRPLETDLACWFPHVHPDDVTAAVDTAVLAFLKQPAAYDPARLPLPGFLRMIARRRLAHVRAAEGRHHAGRIPWDGVELTVPARNEEEKEAPVLEDHPALAAEIEALDEADRRVLALMRDGERDTAVIALALGAADRPADEQARIVKRAKDRILARFKRAVR